MLYLGLLTEAPERTVARMQLLGSMMAACAPKHYLWPLWIRNYERARRESASAAYVHDMLCRVGSAHMPDLLAKYARESVQS